MGQGAPLGKDVAGTGEGVLGQLHFATPLGGSPRHGAIAAVGGEVDGVAVGNTAAVEGLSLRRQLAGSGLAETAIQEPLHLVVALNGALLGKVVQRDGQAGLGGQDHLLQQVVLGHKPTALQAGVVAHVQLGQSVAADVEEPQGLKFTDVDVGEAVVGGLNELQFGAVRQAQGGQKVVAAVHGGEFLTPGQRQAGEEVHLAVEGQEAAEAGQIQLGQAVETAVEVEQFRRVGQVQTGQLVVGAVEPGQRRIPGQVQFGEIVVGDVQGLQVGKGLQTLQAGEALAGQVQFRHAQPLLLGEQAVGADAPQVAAVLQPGLEFLLLEDLRDGHVTLQRPGRRSKGGGRDHLAGHGHGCYYNGYLFDAFFHIFLQKYHKFVRLFSLYSRVTIKNSPVDCQWK